jgi:hypothetical protein
MAIGFLGGSIHQTKNKNVKRDFEKAHPPPWATPQWSSGFLAVLFTQIN